jgi:hypothetical protein
MTHKPSLFLYRAEKHEQFEDMGFVLFVELLNIRQALEGFSVDLHIGRTPEIF